MEISEKEKTIIMGLIERSDPLEVDYSTYLETRDLYKKMKERRKNGNF